MEHGLARHWAVPLRIILGISFMISGAPKLFSGAGHQQIQGMIAQLGIPAAPLLAWVVGIVEFFGGLGLVLGLLTWVASALLTIEMIVAMVLVHVPQGFSAIHVTGMSERGPVFGLPGYQLSLLFIAGLLALFLGGPGPLSVDALPRSRAFGRDSERGTSSLSAPSDRRSRVPVPHAPAAAPPRSGGSPPPASPDLTDRH